MRKPIPKSLRFEVFKRDSFTCQYCGAKAPDVLLHIDHIKPVSDGGENDILNLVTACAGCNLGKSDKQLSDNSAINKQREQLDELAQRRQQLEMMVDWREGLRSIDDDFVKVIQAEFLKYSDYEANENGVKKIKHWIKRYGVLDILKAIDTSFGQYIRIGSDGNTTPESWDKAFNMVPRLIEVERRGGYDQTTQAIFYARGVLRNRLPYMQDYEALKLMQEAVSCGLATDALIEFTKRCTSWTNFKNEMQSVISSWENQ